MSAADEKCGCGRHTCLQCFPEPVKNEDYQRGYDDGRADEGMDCHEHTAPLLRDLAIAVEALTILRSRFQDDPDDEGPFDPDPVDIVDTALARIKGSETNE